MSARFQSLIIAMIVLVLGAVAAVASGASPGSALVAGLAGVAAVIVVAIAGQDNVEPADIEVPPPPPALSLQDHPDFPALMEALETPVLLLGSGRVLAANREAQQLLGDFIVGADVRSAIRHPGAVDRLTRNAAVDVQPDMPIDLIGLGAAEQRWQMRTVAMPADRRLVLLTDQTARDAIDRMRADFVANASHELRTPLAAILGYVETLLDPAAGGDAPLRDRFLTIIDGEARRMQRLVLDLLSISRIESQKHLAPTDTVAVDRLTQMVVDELRASGAARANAIALSIAANLPPVPGDQAQLSQMLHNIITNGMKYGRDGTPVAVDVALSQGGLLRIMVQDEGDGIAPEHLPRLTERFYRIDSARSRAMDGTGLGLAIVRHVIERHRGELDIASEVGRGTTVTVRLPVVRG
jgi:two-component system, OmpR family, phosphate regulon sensor histidine kinase PhoR